MTYPADPPTVEEIVAVMRRIPVDRHGLRLRAMIVVLWRGGLRIQEALDLTESDLDARRGSILVRAGKGNKRREVGMDPWGKRRDKTGMEKEMRTLYIEDVASHGGPESCVGVREGAAKR